MSTLRVQKSEVPNFKSCDYEVGFLLHSPLPRCTIQLGLTQRPQAETRLPQAKYLDAWLSRLLLESQQISYFTTTPGRAFIPALNLDYSAGLPARTVKVGFEAIDLSRF